MGPKPRPTVLAPSFALVGNRCHSLVATVVCVVPQVYLEAIGLTEGLSYVAIELEIKIRVESHESIRAALRDAGAEYVSHVLETNRLLDLPDGALLKAGCGLRVRSVDVLDGDGPKTTLTYKGPREAGPVKRREELEVAVEDAAAMTSVLKALGYGERIVFEKRRESWRMDDCRVELDEVPLLGTFVEIEGPTEASIEAVRQRLGLAGHAIEPRTYVALLTERGDDDAADPRVFRFESPS